MQSSTPKHFSGEETSFVKLSTSISPIVAPQAEVFSPLDPAFVCEAVLGDSPRRTGLAWPVMDLFPPSSGRVHQEEDLDLNQAYLQESSNKFSPEKVAPKKTKKPKVIRKLRTEKDRIVNGEVMPYAFISELPCIVCEKVYVSKKFLQRHKRNKHRICKPVHQLDCQHCGALFPDVESFTKHCEETDEQIKEYNEKGLFQKTEQNKNADKHTVKRKMVILEQRLAYIKNKRYRSEDHEWMDKPDGGLYNCNSCNFTSDLEAVKLHVGSEHGGEVRKAENVPNLMLIHDGEEWQVKKELA